MAEHEQRHGILVFPVLSDFATAFSSLSFIFSTVRCVPFPPAGDGIGDLFTKLDGGRTNLNSGAASDVPVLLSPLTPAFFKVLPVHTKL
ncbi:hypothetical protein SDJN02_25239, partial [Cucurbita argyrosperma subsp. argyrosperma]